ncbi:AAA family ATPase [Kitasatospora sp. NBC_00240]|nr:AAA family ATPase [Kitasatospora sp. NBC_00240]
MAEAETAGATAERRTGFAFVGRERELRALTDSCRHAPAVVLVEGEAGIGKSRLLREAERLFADGGVPVLRAACHQLREPLPFGPAVDALRAGWTLCPTETRFSPATAVLAPYLPGLADRLPTTHTGSYPGLDPDTDDSARRRLLMRAVHEVLAAIGPAVLMVEDLHWADEATRDLLSLLARNPPDRLRLVLTYRESDLPGNGTVLGAPYRRPVGVGGTEIRLQPLSPEQVRHLAVSALGAAASTALCRDLFERSGGLPLAAEEDLLGLADRLARHPDASAPSLETQGVPRALQEAVVSRIGPLAPDARAVVESAAVLAVLADQDLLAAVAHLTEEQAEQGLTDALEAHVLTEGEPGRYGFRHTLARLAVCDAIPAPRRRRLHARAAQALQVRQPPALVQIAHHVRLLGDTPAWIAAAVAAADHALAVGDDGIAADLLQQLLAEPALPPDLRGRCALDLSAIAMVRSDPAASEAILRRIVADPALETGTRGEIRLNLARALAGSNVHWDSRAELERAISELEGRPGPAAAALASLSLGTLMNPQGGDLAESLGLMERAAHLAATCDDPDARAFVLANRITLLELVGDPRGRELLDLLPRGSTDLGVLRHRARALHDAAYFEMARGCDGQARALLDEAEELSRRTAFPYLELSCRTIRLHLDLVGGRWQELAERIDTLLRDTTENSTARLGALLARAMLDSACGRWARAREDLAPLAAAYGEEIGPMAVIALARLDLAEGDPAAAWGRLDPVVAATRRKNLWMRPLDLAPTAVRAALGCGLTDPARRLTDDAQNGIQGLNAPGVEAGLHWCRAMLDADTEPETALRHLEQARTRYRAIGRVHTAAQVAEHIGCLELARSPDRPDTAVGHLRDALDTFTRLGATADAARCEQVLRSNGRRPASRPRRDGASVLSQREQQVAELLADGATNQHIAGVLAISPRTAEHHVANTLKKLGVTRTHVRDAPGAAGSRTGGPPRP